MNAESAPRSGATNELAKERNRAAAERTLTSWIGNCLSLIGFGLAFDRIIGAFSESDGRITLDDYAVPFIALTAIGLGVFLLILAIIVHRKVTTLAERPGEASMDSSTLSLLSTAAVVLLGLIALASAFIRAR